MQLSSLKKEKMFREWIKNIRAINNMRRTSFFNDEEARHSKQDKE